MIESVAHVVEIFVNGDNKGHINNVFVSSCFGCMLSPYKGKKIKALKI